MRIGFSTSVIQRGKTGVAQYVFALLQALRPFAKEHQFHIFTLKEDLCLLEPVAEGMRLVSVNEEHRPPVKNILWHQRELPRMARKLSLDVLHVPSYRRMLWPKPCALVATIHDLAPFRVAKKYDLARMIYGRFVAKELARKQDQIIAVSGNTAEDIKTFFKIPPNRVTVIHNGLDHARFHPGTEDRRAAARRFGLREPFFLYVARLEHPGKNHVRLIEAFDSFKSRTGSKYHLVFAGSDWHGAEVIHQRVKDSPFCEEIRTLGFVKDEELPPLYQSAHAMVYPSLYEGFGLPPLEAMACGCPAISSDRGSLGEVIGDAALRVDPENPESIARALEQVATDESLHQRLRELGLARARIFSWQKSAAQTMEVYEKALF
jgi:glycosyltransferase involved in cell wall biosynthesis